MILQHEQNTIIGSKKVFFSIARALNTGNMQKGIHNAHPKDPRTLKHGYSFPFPSLEKKIALRNADLLIDDNVFFRCSW